MIDLSSIDLLPEFDNLNSFYKSAKVSTDIVLKDLSIDNIQELYVMSGSKLTLSDIRLLTPQIHLIIIGELRVEGRIELSPNSVIIISEKAKITGDGILVGNNSKISTTGDAVITDSVSIEGIWNQEYTNIAWFSSSKASDDITIQNAINLQGAGDVYLEKKLYNILAPIEIPVGIKLHGVSAINDSETNRTVIKANDNFQGTYLFEVNAEYKNGKWSWKYPYPTPDTEISNLWIEGNKYGNPRGMIIGGGFKIQNVAFRELQQAIKQTEDYADGRRISHVSFKNWETISGDMNLPAIDLYGPGDGLYVSQINIDNGKFPVLRVGRNCGSVITTSILNGKVIFKSVKALSFIGNHMECNLGNDHSASIEVGSSSLSIQSCYLEKGNTPSIILISEEGSVVANISDCIFAFQSGYRESGEGSTPTALAKRINAISQYDIAIDNRVMLNLSNNYRYDIRNVSDTIEQNTLGIWLAECVKDATTNKYSFEALRTINQQSAWWSQQSSISCKQIVSAPSIVVKPSTASAGYLAKNNNIIWLEESNTYSYLYCFLSDTDSETNITYKPFVGSSNTVTLEQGKAGIHFSVFLSSIEMRGKVALKRNMVNNGSIIHTKTLILPVCGGQVFYDNGISIGGFKWL